MTFADYWSMQIFALGATVFTVGVAAVILRKLEVRW